MTQEQRLNYLLQELLRESQEYHNIAIPSSLHEKEVLFRSLMNVRTPKGLEEQTLQIQDEYLQERIRDFIIDYKDLPTLFQQGFQCPHAQSISLWKGDITTLSIDAIVNAANSQMLGCFIPMHTCIDNCIHTYAGMQLRLDCFRKMTKKGQGYQQPTSIPMLTSGYNLPAKAICHVVGPIVETSLTDEHRQQLADCYTNCLDLCLEHGFTSIAFCCLSTGVFHFPNQEAAHIAIDTVLHWMDMHPDGMQRVVFNVFKEEDQRYYEQEFAQWISRND